VLAREVYAAAEAWCQRGRTAGERRRGARLEKHEREARECFLTKCRSLGGRESGGEATAVKINASGRASRAAAASSIGYTKIGEGGVGARVYAKGNAARL
jgi:hypothetical protein